MNRLLFILLLWPLSGWGTTFSQTIAFRGAAASQLPVGGGDTPVQTNFFVWHPTSSEISFFTNGDAGNPTSLNWTDYKATIDDKDITGFVIPGNTMTDLYLGTRVGTNAFGDAIDIQSQPALTNVDLGAVTTHGWHLNIFDCTNLISISATNLTTVSGDVIIYDNTAMTSLLLPELNGVTAYTLSGNSSLTSINLPSEAIIGMTYLDANGCTALTTVTIGSLSPFTTTAYVDLSGCALSGTTVNYILSKAVNSLMETGGTVYLNGGTSAAPSGQGATDKQKLIDDGVDVSTN